MKLRQIYIGAAAIALLFAALTGCAKPPIAEMDSAREAVFRAESDADAVQYGGNSLARARDALRLMENEADLKRYDAAKVHAAEAVAAAEKAVADGKAAAGRAKEEAASAISGLKPEIEETSRNASAARYSQLNLDYDALETELMGAYAQTDKAESAYAEGRYQDSIDNARSARSSLYGINQQISNAVPRNKF